MSENEFTMPVDEKVSSDNAVDEKPKRVKKEKPIFEGERPFKVESPEGYDFFKHAPLKKDDFDTESLFMLWKACRCEAQAIKLRADAEKIKSLGGKKQQAKAKKYLKMREQLAMLQEQLAAQGIDLDSLVD